MKKIEYVYHGSPYLFDIVEPRQARGSKPEEALCAIYAYSEFDHVVPFALPKRPHKGKYSFSCSKGKTKLIYGSIIPNGKGYIYKLKADTFKHLSDGEQMVFFVPVVPEEIIEINVKDYLHTVEFSEEAAKIQQELYGNIEI